MPDIYYDPHADALREIADLNLALVARKGRKSDGERLRAMLRQLVEGGALSQSDQTELSGIRSRYGADVGGIPRSQEAHAGPGDLTERTHGIHVDEPREAHTRSVG